MAKPKAPVWLREAFRDGVDEFAAAEDKLPERDYARGGCQEEACWLAPFDGHRRPCKGPFERFHFVNRERVENALGALLPTSGYFPTLPDDRITQIMDGWDRAALILLAAWDSRNGAIGCEGHHRRLDNHATPSLIVPQSRLPDHVREFAHDWGLQGSIDERFPPEHTIATADLTRVRP